MGKKYLFVLSIIFLMVSCSDRPSKIDYDRIKAELEDCKKENETNKKIISDLKFSPQQRLAEAKRLFDGKNHYDAKTKFEEIVSRYPNTTESKISTSYINEIDLLFQKAMDEQEKIKTLGYKALRETNKVTVGEISMNFGNVSIAKNFVFDRYDDAYHYREAERGNKYVVASVSISSESKDPNFPPVYIYTISKGQLVYAGTLEYEFARWDDYGSYLGNYTDFRNDFAHTKTIRFELGLQVSEVGTKNNPVFILVGNTNSFERTNDRFANPPIGYKRTNYDYKNTLTIEDFKQDYTLVKIFNRNLL